MAIGNKSSPKKSALQKALAAARPSAKIANNSRIPSGRRSTSRAHDPSGAARKASTQAAQRTGEGAPGAVTDDTEPDVAAIPARVFPEVLNQESPKRWDYSIVPRTEEWNEIELAFKEEIPKGSIQEILSHCFDEYERHLISTTSHVTPVLRTIRQQNSQRYTKLLRNRFGNYPSSLAVKLTMLYLGHPVAPLNGANLLGSNLEYDDPYAVFRGDLPDPNRDMSQDRVPLQYLAGHAERIYGRKDPSGERLPPTVLARRYWHLVG